MKTRAVLKSFPSGTVETRCPAVKTCSPQVPHRVFCSVLTLFWPFLRFRETVFVKNVVFQEHGNSLLSKFAISLWSISTRWHWTPPGSIASGQAQRQSKEDRRARNRHSAKPKRTSTRRASPAEKGHVHTSCCCRRKRRMERWARVLWRAGHGCVADLARPPEHPCPA